MARVLHIMIAKAWTTGNLSTKWNISSIIAIPKKKGICTIALIQSAAKIYAEIINKRIKQQAKVFVGSTQCGFVSGRSTSDAIFYVDRIREICVEYRRKKYLHLLTSPKHLIN